jgi:MFS family permease
MHTIEAPTSTLEPDDGRPWWGLLSGYHWFVLAVCALGWMFDCLDQQLFNIARRPAIAALVNDPAQIDPYSNYATSIFLLGWGTGGIIFGILGDLIGRARTMMLTILFYSVFTGLSALSVGFWDFSLYRFLTGLGVGGEFAVGVALVAEVMPERARPFALGLLQALSAFGNIAAAIIGFVFAYLEYKQVIPSAWRMMFVIGTVPAALALLIFRRLKEPERWQAAAAKSTLRERLQAYFRALFESPRWAKNAVLGLVLASAGIIGLWGIGFFSIDLQRAVFKSRYVAEGMSEVDVKYHVDSWAAVTSAILNVGAFFGIYAFSRVTHVIGRRPAFAISLSFCYNVARFVAAFGLAAKGVISGLFEHYRASDPSLPVRYAGLTMCGIFMVGILVLPFLPETKGRPLPE